MSVLGDFGEYALSKVRVMTLSEVMHVHIPFLSLEATVRDAVDKMDVYQFPALVFVDGSRHPVAVITEGDVARAVGSKGDVVSLGSRRALDFATRDPFCASMDMEVSEALHTMLSRGLTILPVVHKGKAMGVVLRVDLMQALFTDVGSYPER